MADLLLLPLRKEPESAAILTGKFFEYVAAGAPILAFGPRESNLATELKESGSGIICEWTDREAITDAIDNAYRRFLQQEADESQKALTKAQLKYSRKTLTGQLSGLLNSLNNLTK